MQILCAKCGQDCHEDEYGAHVANNCLPTEKCPTCSRYFNSTAALLRHAQVKHSKVIQCPICQLEFQFKNKLRRHMALEHKEKVKDDFKCEVCGEMFKGKYFLDKHMKGIHKKQFTCQVCKQNFHSNYSLHRHMSRRHKQGDDNEKNEIEKIKCPKCGKRIIKRALEKHYRLNHSQLYICHVCDKSLQNEKSLQSHIDRRHPEEKNEEELLKRKWKCPQCPVRFTSKWHCQNHIKAVHHKEFFCNICETDYACKYNLQRHMAREHKDIDQEALKNHLDSREAEWKSEENSFKKYQCPHCPARFVASWTMKTHIKGKHEQKFDCNICGKSLAGPFPLVRHKRNVHGVDNKNETASPDCIKPKRPREVEKYQAVDATQQSDEVKMKKITS